MVLVKICGITNVEDALAAVDAGADVLGFNFCQRSPRYITPEAARAIIARLPEGMLTVGVFVDEELDAVKWITIETGISALQLHGNESPEYCKVVDPNLYRIKVFAAGPDFNPASVHHYGVNAIMLDAVDKGGIGGGTGRLSDWSVARETREIFPRVFLAGGLSAENVGEAIKFVKPFGVDACSLLEDAPGRKNHERVRAFVAAARKAGGDQRARDLLKYRMPGT